MTTQARQLSASAVNEPVATQPVSCVVPDNPVYMTVWKPVCVITDIVPDVGNLAFDTSVSVNGATVSGCVAGEAAVVVAIASTAKSSVNSMYFTDEPDVIQSFSTASVGAS